MTDLFPVTTGEMIAELEREIAMRKRVYPRWIADKKMTQAKADRAIRVIEAAARYITERQEGV